MMSSETLRVAYLVNEYPKVSHSFIRREIQALERLGVSVQRLSIRGGSSAQVEPQDLAEQGKTRYILRHPPSILVAVAAWLFARPVQFGKAFALATRLGWRADRALWVHWIYLAESCLVARWLKHTCTTHLHAHFGTNSATVALLASALSGIPFSVTVHGPEEFERAQMISLPEKIRRAAFIVGISSFCRSQIYRWASHEHWHKVHVVRCGVDSAFHSTADRRPNAAATLVCVGRLCDEKAQLLLLLAMRQLIDRGIACQLTLAGDGDLRPAIEAQIKALGLTEYIRITGWIHADRVREEILAARALVLPSFAEGLPVVLMEAMALGRPVISTAIAGIPELVREGETGWLVSAGDVDALSASMQKCLEASSVELEHMGLSARKLVSTMHDVDLNTQRLAALFAHRSL